MRIALISPHFSEYSLSYARALSQAHEVLLILNRQNYENEVGVPPSSFETESLKIVCLEHSRSVYVLFKNALSYSRLLVKFGPDIVHLQEEPKDYLLLHLILGPKYPKVLTIHDLDPHPGADSKSQRFHRHRLYRWFLRRSCQGFFAHTDAIVKAASVRYKKTHIASGPHGPLGLLHDVQATQTPSSKRVLFFGRMQEYKGLGYFVEAIKRARITDPGIVGVLAGRGPELELLKNHLKDDCGFEIYDKYLTPREVIEYFDESQVVVLPYTEASQSGVAAYAIGRGRPLVVSDVGGLTEMINTGSSGIAVKPRDVVSLSDAIVELCTNKPMAESFGVEALRLGGGRLSWEANVSACVDLYRRVILG